MSLPENEDPDSLSKKLDESKFKEFLKSRETDLINYKVKILNENYKNDPVKKSDMIFDIVKSISKPCINPFLSSSSREWCAHVTVVPDNNKTNVFINGISQGSKTSISFGGQTFPTNSLGKRLASK